MPYRTIIEPFKIHSVQAIDFPSPEEREAALRARRIQPLRIARR